MKKLLRIFAPAVFAVTAAAAGASGTASIEIRGHSASVSVAETAEELQHGLMGVQAMPENRGMLFVFPKSGSWCMWMKNTPLPLSVAFFDDNFRLISIASMTPWSTEIHCALNPARYALEMNDGWFTCRKARIMSRVWGRHAPTRSLRKCRCIEEVKSRMDRKFSRIENLWPRDGSCPLPLRSKLIFNKCFRIVKAQK